MDAAVRDADALAVACLDRAAAEAPDLGHEDIRQAVNAVVAFRDRVLAATRDGRTDREALDRANAIVSLAYGGEFPLTGLHRRRFAQARDAMAALVDGQS
jgi:hypothetical protein